MQLVPCPIVHVYMSCLQFVVAGDHLVHHCPTWQWASVEGATAKSYLPADKQFLVTRNGECFAWQDSDGGVAAYPVWWWRWWMHFCLTQHCEMLRKNVTHVRLFHSGGEKKKRILEHWRICRHCAAEWFKAQYLMMTLIKQCSAEASRTPC